MTISILWFNFSSSTSYPNGPVSSGMSIYIADLVDKGFGKQHSICNCCSLKSRHVNVTNKRDVNVDIKNICVRSLGPNNGQSAVGDLLDISIFYRILMSTIRKMYTVFDFDNRNMAVFLPNDTKFDVEKVILEFQDELKRHYNFTPLTVTTEKDDGQLPFNADDSQIAKFMKWIDQVEP